MDVGRRDQLAAVLLALLLIGLAAAVTLPGSLSDEVSPAAPARQSQDAVQFDRFAAHRDRTAEGERLSVSLRLRTSASVSLPCFIFVVARNDHATPRRWTIWPPQAPGPAVTAGGHFHGSTPATGHAITLSDQWERVTATLAEPDDGVAFDTVVVYIVDADGRTLLSRPFRV
jgi:hypothetical protein